MSVATELVPVVDIPEQARAHRPAERLATVTTLHRPSAATVAPPVRLTRRGVVVLSALVAVAAALLVGAAWVSAPTAASPSAPAPVADTVVVHAGDTLWSIAARIAPQRDPRAEVADLQRANQLASSELTPGQVLRTH